MARGWHYTKLSIECPSSIFFWHVYYFVIVPFFLSFLFFKENQNTPRPSSEHPPVMGGKMSKRLGGIKGSFLFLKKNLSASRPSDHLSHTGGKTPDGSYVGSTV